MRAVAARLRSGVFACALLTVSHGARAAETRGATGPPAERSGKESDGLEAKPPPNIYIDFSATFGKLPGNTLLIGSQNLVALRGASSKDAILSFPLTVDVTDRMSLYAGVDGASIKSEGSPWTRMTVENWNIGGSYDIIQSGPNTPTVTLSASASRPFSAGFLGVFTTTYSAGLDVDYAFDEDETRGLLAGVSYAHTHVESSIGNVRPTILVYGGAYYAWPNKLKLSARAGLQQFRGANIGTVLAVKRRNQPFIKFDLDRMDDNDNQLIGVSIALGWSPKPGFQLSLSMPLYVVRN